MAHVQIPAKEDVNQFPFHHTGVATPSFTLTGEGCEVEKVNANDFVIRVPTASFDAFQSMTDLSPLWDAIHELETRVKWATENQDYNVQDALSRGKLHAERIERLSYALSNLEARHNIDSANLAAARDSVRFALYGAALSTTISVAMGIALWILKG